MLVLLLVILITLEDDAVSRAFFISLMNLRNITGDQPAADMVDIVQCYVRQLTEEMNKIAGNASFVQLLRKRILARGAVLLR